jgi:hypothetical protein
MGLVQQTEKKQEVKRRSDEGEPSVKRRRSFLPLTIHCF